MSVMLEYRGTETCDKDLGTAMNLAEKCKTRAVVTFRYRDAAIGRIAEIRSCADHKDELVKHFNIRLVN